MKKHKIQNIIKKQGGNYQVVFNDGERVFWPREQARGLMVGTTVREYKHKNGQTVAFSWRNELRFVVPVPMHITDAADFVNQFKMFDKIAFNNAIIRALDIVVDPLVFPDNEKIAHNLFFLGLQKTRNNTR